MGVWNSHKYYPKNIRNNSKNAFYYRIISSGQDDEPVTDEECSTSSNENEIEEKKEEKEKEEIEGESESDEEVTHNSEVQVKASLDKQCVGLNAWFCFGRC